MWHIHSTILYVPYSLDLYVPYSFDSGNEEDLVESEAEEHPHPWELLS